MLIFLLAACPSSKDDTADTDTSDTAGPLVGPSGDATATNDCAPDDGAAVTFVIGLDAPGCEASSAGVPNVQITLYTGRPLDPGSYPFGDFEDGSAWFSEDGTTQLSVSDGTVTIDSWSDTITGSYVLTVQGGATYAGTFEAVSCDSTIMCG